MKPRAGCAHRAALPTRSATAVLVILVMVSVGVVSASQSVPPSGSDTSAGGAMPATSPWSVSSLASAPLHTVNDSEPGIDLANAVPQGPASVSGLTILVTFPLSQSQALSQFLTELSTPGSPEYHHYLTPAEFDQQYGGAPGPYDAAVAYFESLGVSDLTTAADHLTLTLQATPVQVESIFHTSIEDYRAQGLSYYAPFGPPQLPEPLAGAVANVEGLSSYSSYLFQTSTAVSVSTAQPSSAEDRPLNSTVQGFLPPATVNGTQHEYAPDLQVAYDELSLFAENGYPKDAVVATIFEGGCTENNNTCPVADRTGAFYPTDIYDFYNETLPAGEPHSSVYGVPLDGAVAPGPSSGDNQRTARGETTLDLEMVGSTAPGASIYNVYGPDLGIEYVDQAFSYILNPVNTSGLANVSVITNSWGLEDQNDTTWYQDLSEAQARGITVLASSGDSGDDPNSTHWRGSDTLFPSSMSYDTFGVTAVGGTTITLDSNSSSGNFLHITNLTAWYVNASDKADQGPAGSGGGVSQVFPEPAWQVNSSANGVITAAAARLGIRTGRGTPDLGVIANNTLYTLTFNGTQCRASNATYGGRFCSTWGTSIASPVEAGIVAEIDHVLAAHSNPWLGFLNPQLYSLADEQIARMVNTTSTGYSCTGPGDPRTCPYASTLPTLPLDMVGTGANYLFTAQRGYSLVTGWGAIDAYNYTMYCLSVNSTGLAGRLAGVQDELNLSGLSVTSHFPGGGINHDYNASIQQNFFLANSLGAPIYWVQNVIYITKEGGGWKMDYTGWVVYPQHADTLVYEYNISSSVTVALPKTFDIQTTLAAPNGFNTQYVNYSVGNQQLELPVPGAAFIIGALNYTYSWQGVNYTNGQPSPDTGSPWHEAPQFGLVGGPSGGIGNFTSPTAGSLTVLLEPYGTNQWMIPATEAFGEEGDQTGEKAANLSWEPTGPNTWSIGVAPGASRQGVVAFLDPGPLTYPVTFVETGLANGTRWSADLNGTVESSSTTTIRFLEEQGRFPYTVPTVPGYTGSQNGTVLVNDTSATVDVAFGAIPPPTYSVSFVASGLSSGARWSITLSGHEETSGGAQIDFVVTNGTFAFSVGAPSGFVASPASGTVIVDGGNVAEAVSFSPSLPGEYYVTFVETGLPSGSNWSVVVSGPVVTRENSTATSIVAVLPNGTYRLEVAEVGSYYPYDPQVEFSSSFMVLGAPLSVPITFAYGYALTFNESGLSSGLSWSVNVTNGTGATVEVIGFAGSSITFYLGNGSYAYAIGLPEGNSAKNTSGTTAIDGRAVTVPTVEVSTSSGPPSTPFFLYTPWGLAIVAAIAVVVIVGFVAVIRYRRKP